MPKRQSRIEKLIAELCPEGVEVKSIDEICQINRGRVMSKDYLRNNAGEYPVYSSQTAEEGVFGRINTYDYDGEYITWTTDGANAGSIFYRDGKFSITNVCGLLKAKNNGVNAKFLSYILATVSKEYVSAGMGNPKIMSNVMGKIKIPIPPLAIQQEIVKILDTFTTLEAELEAELEARKKQYEYYRDELLTFGEDVEWKTLGELATLITKGTTPKYFTNSGINFVKLESFKDGKINPAKFAFVHEETHRKELKRSILEVNDILFAIAGATIGKCAMVEESILPANTNQALAIVRLGTGANVRFIFYYMQTIAMVEYIAKYNKTSAQPNLNLQQMSDFPVPIPPIAEQNRIVAILDKFDALVNDISIGLPAELNARRKQYEYYRNKLLTFKPLENKYA
jgi:type I restriction enzyme, S subunit